MRLLRLIAAYAVVAVGSTAMCLLLIPLLPSRIRRVRLSIRFGRAMARAVLAILGIRVQVTGAFPGPAICVGNHRSTLDTWAILTLLPDDIAGVVKAEVAWLPLFGQAYLLSGHLRVHRADRERAVAGMRELAGFMRRHALGAWLMPEGTRSRDGQLGPFKRGFVHLAKATGLPVVPVIMEGAADLWPLGGLPRAGVLRVEILAPTPTVDWADRDAADCADEVRSRFLARLGRPPG